MSGICSANECEPDFILQPDIPTPVGLSDGQITVDSLFFQWFRTEKFNVAVGRMETKYVARGGVYAKSLDRNDSNNLRINWTDGIQTTYKANNGWNSNLVLQYNSSDGSSNIRRSPLNFSESGSRVSTFVASCSVHWTLITCRRRSRSRLANLTAVRRQRAAVGNPIYVETCGASDSRRKRAMARRVETKNRRRSGSGSIRFLRTPHLVVYG